MEEILQKIRPWGFGAALVSCSLNAVWIVCLFRLFSISSDTVQQVVQAPNLFRVSVGACVLLTGAAVPIVLALGLTAAAEQFPGRALVGSLLYFCYIPINLTAYYLYGMVFPRMVSTNEESLLLKPLMIAVDVGQPFALFGNLPILGYGLLGIGWCVLASALIRRSKLWQWTSGFLILSGTFSVIGAAGDFMDAELMSKGTIVGGMFSLPAFGLLAAALWQDMQSKTAIKDA